MIRQLAEEKEENCVNKFKESLTVPGKHKVTPSRVSHRSCRISPQGGEWHKEGAEHACQEEKGVQSLCKTV